MQTGLKIRDEHRRWTEDEIDTLREHIATHTVAETAKMLGRSAKSVRCALQRYDLKIREIRCDMDVDRLPGEDSPCATSRRSSPGSRMVGWRRQFARTVSERGYVITPEAFRALYTRHLSELIAQKRIPSVALFEAFYNYCFVPKHTTGTQLLTVRRDKRERAAFMAMQNGAESEEEDDETQE